LNKKILIVDDEPAIADALDYITADATSMVTQTQKTRAEPAAGRTYKAF
jgi:DNA-binding response OmpR family regulator